MFLIKKSYPHIMRTAKTFYGNNAEIIVFVFRNILRSIPKTVSIINNFSVLSISSEKKKISTIAIMSNVSTPIFTSLSTNFIGFSGLRELFNLKTSSLTIQQNKNFTNNL